jgi:hypothetical protein
LPRKVEGPAGVGERLVPRPDDAIVDDLGARDVFSERPSIHGRPPEIEKVAQPIQQRRQSARVVKVLHQEFPGRPQVRDHGHAAGYLVETVERQGHARAPRQREQVNDRVS